MTAYLRARLVGGPFDGDVGTLNYNDLPYGSVVEPPPSIWAWRCSNPLCPASGTHWAPEQAKAESQAARYDLVEGAEEQTHLYAYGEMLDPTRLAAAEELAVA